MAPLETGVCYVVVVMVVVLLIAGAFLGEWR